MRARAVNCAELDQGFALQFDIGVAVENDVLDRG